MWVFSKKGPSGFSANSTAEEVTHGIDGSALTAIVTGASSGIGAETARVLTLRGVHVIMGVRNISAGKQVKEAIIKDVPQAKIDALELDLSSLSSVRNFASNYNSLGLPLNLLMYNGLSAYGQSKLANVLHANELAKHLKGEGMEITANSVHPGAIASNLFRQHSIISGIVNVIGKHVMKNVQQGAATTCYVALHTDVKGVSGKYFADCNTAETSPQANDAELAKRLWDFTMSLVD
ncbi:Short-chain dehydrogenase TIC 32, chloroplastic [Capsicum annuum]|nr:Short-chain dehydrogenase TIC 32, chloroplastic [Capsicum annuum]